MYPITAKRTFLVGVLGLLVVVAGVRAEPLGPGFTFQGRLEDSGGPATGTYDLIFVLYDVEMGGAQSGLGCQCVENVSPIDGLFTVILNNADQLGANPFDGSERWLEVRVRSDTPGSNPCPAGCGLQAGFTALAPRQKLTVAPHAAFSLTAPWTGLSGVPADLADGDDSGGTLDQSYDFGGPGNGRVITLDAGAVNLDGAVDASLTSDGLFMLGSVDGPNVIFDRNEVMARDAGATTKLALNAEGGDVTLIQSGTGNVGIGTGTPAQKLTVVGMIRSTTGGFMFPNGTVQTSAAIGGTGFWDSSGSHIHNNNSGNVGIGTDTPSSKLSIISSEQALDAYSATVGQPTATFIWGFGGGTAIKSIGDVVVDPGNVGIGVSIPDVRLHVDGAENDGTVAGVKIESGSQALLLDGNEIDSNTSLFLNNNTPENVILATGGGNIGIGTSSPQAKLDVSGTARVDVLEIMGADLAEKFPASEKLAPGMVVAIDARNPGQLCLARGEYNRAVAGVVSGANEFGVGAVLGNLPGCENAPAIALTGRVYVRCDATEQAIEPADLLTTSDTPGHAMKAVDRDRAHGAIIGKAMTALPKGETGLVLVLVNLQ